MIPAEVGIQLTPETADLINNIGIPAAFALGLMYLFFRVVTVASQFLLVIRKRDEVEAKNDDAHAAVLQQMVSMLGMVLGPTQKAIENSNIIGARVTEAMNSISETLKGFQGKVTDLEGAANSAAAAIDSHHRWTVEQVAKLGKLDDILTATTDTKNGVDHAIQKIDTLQTILQAVEGAMADIRVSLVASKSATEPAEPRAESPAPQAGESKEPATAESGEVTK